MKSKPTNMMSRVVANIFASFPGVDDYKMTSGFVKKNKKKKRKGHSYRVYKEVIPGNKVSTACLKTSRRGVDYTMRS